MWIFDDEEMEYLGVLMSRNYLTEIKNRKKPLGNPMNDLEKKLRKNIGEKCDGCMASLVLAEVCGILPNDRMKRDGFDSIKKEMETIFFMHSFEEAKSHIENKTKTEKK